MRPLAAWLVLSVAPSLTAHEFWLAPDSSSVTPGTTVKLTLNVGEDFTGLVRPFNTEKVAALRHYSAAGVVDLLPRVPAPPGLDAFPLLLTRAGTYVVAEDSAPSTIVLSPDKFLAYLNDDGLEFVAEARKAAKQEGEPGRERYLRCVKTLLRVGEKSDATFEVRTGQRLEIVPQSDPFAARAGSRIVFTVFFDGKPLIGAQVRAWHHRAKNLVTLKGRSGADGSIAFELPYAGSWMISLVHMIPLRDVPGYDWQSYWGNLTFSLPDS